MRFCELSPKPKEASSFDTEIWIADARNVAPDGGAMTRVVCLESRAIGWIPTALTLALVGSLSIPWRRRCVALGLSLLLIHVFVLFSLTVCIAHQINVDQSLAWPHLGPTFSFALYAAYETLITHFGAGLVAAIIVWVCICAALHRSSLHWFYPQRASL